MDEIDKVVDNLFSQYLKPGSAVAPGTPQIAAVQSEQPPSPPPAEHPPDDLVFEASPSPVVEPQQVPAVQPPVQDPKSTVAFPAQTPVADLAPARKTAPKKKKRKTGNKGIKEIKLETAKMLRHLSMAIKSENWWHKLYYSNKFVRNAMYISQIITKRKK